jgi:hypothetical protein
MYQQLWGFKVEEKLYLGGTRTKKVEYHCPRGLSSSLTKEIHNYPKISEISVSLSGQYEDSPCNTAPCSLMDLHLCDYTAKYARIL